MKNLLTTKKSYYIAIGLGSFAILAGLLSTNAFNWKAELSTTIAAADDVTILAKGWTGEEKIELHINGNIVASYILSTSYQKYIYTPAKSIVIKKLEVHFINDQLSPVDRNVDIDSISVAELTFQTEAPNTYSESELNTGETCGNGFEKSETMNCNGFMRYAVAPGIIVLGDGSIPNMGSEPPITTVPVSGADIEFEAEDMALNGPMISKTSGNTTYITNNLKLQGTAQKRIVIPTDGVYQIQFRVRTWTPLSNSLFFTLGGKEKIHHLGINLNFNWVTYEEGIALEKGENTFTIRGRETNTLIDAVRITKTGQLQPAPEPEPEPQPQPEPGTPANCGTDRVMSLLSSPDRIGFGAATIGGKNATSFTKVTNTNDSGAGSFREAITNGTGPVWIIFDDSLRGKTILLNKAINTFRKNITIDGRGSDGKMNNITISPSDPANAFALFQFRGGDTIIHGITVDGRGSKGTAMMQREGDLYWFDHLTITNWSSDDSLSFGQGGNSNSANKFTVSNYKAYNTSRGLRAGGNDNYPDYPLTQGTVLFSDLGGKDRNPRMQYGAKWHFYNNFVHDFIYGGVIAGRSAQLIVENNVISANKANNVKSSLAGRVENDAPTGHIYISGNILLNGAVAVGSINPSSPQKFNIPYSYSLMPTNEVQAYVLANAGAQKASGSLEYCN